MFSAAALRIELILVVMLAIWSTDAAATTPGPTDLLPCPASRDVVVRWTLASGNTFRGTLFSDGEIVFPMLPRLPTITRCGGRSWMLQRIGNREAHAGVVQ